MIRLINTTDNLQVVLAGAVTVNQLQCSAFWVDVTTTLYTPGRTLSVTSGATDVNIVAAPGSGVQRIIDYLSVYNTDTVNATVTIKIDASGTEYILFRGILATGETLQYNDKDGFKVLTIAGAIKSAQMLGANNAVINILNTVVLAADVINNNATLNTIASVTGLEFPVTSDETYWFEFVIPYTSAATTTGSRWSITGPTFTLLNYRSEYTLAAATTTVNSANTYDTPAASNATSLAAGNIATLWGIITPSANGSVIARFASEIANSAITAKAGATLRWMRVR